jgi:hypothetical protein
MKVRLYRTRDAQRVTALAVASPKDTFAILSDDDVKEKHSSLLGEFETDGAGEFVAVLDKDYDGGPFEVDVYCEKVPGGEGGSGRPVQFSLTVLQPSWRRAEEALFASWEYCLSYRYWCLVRAKFDAWAICGRVTVCDTGAPAAGVMVKAFDADWLQDDPLGSALTDPSGKFRIDYSGAAFRKDIFGLNIELFGGPDLYFHVETPSGTALLTEPSSRGRKPDRENIGHCFCAELCVEDAPVVTYAWFTRVGDFSIYSDINRLTDGLTTRAMPFGFAGAHGGPGYAFTGSLKLIGDCPTTYPTGGPPMRYRFLYNDGSGLNPMTAAHILATAVGSRPILWDDSGFGATMRPQTIYVAPSGATPPGPTPPPSPLPPAGTSWGPIPPIVIVPDADGWVTVDPAATNQGFSGPLLLFNSASVVPGGIAPSSGASNPPADPKQGTMLSIVFQAEPTGGHDAPHPTLTNDLPKIYVNNWSAVMDLGLVEFEAPGATSCSALTTDLHIKYTTHHEMLGWWGLGISSAAAIPGAPLTLPHGPTGPAPHGDHGTEHLNISTWLPCSYVISLGTWRKLTNGETDDSGTSTQITFCKD